MLQTDASTRKTIVNILSSINFRDFQNPWRHCTLPLRFEYTRRHTRSQPVATAAPLALAASVVCNSPVTTIQEKTLGCFLAFLHQLEMGHQFHHHNNHNEEHHHQAVDGLVNLFTKANNDLTVVHNRLEKEFRETYPDNANPMKLVSRIKKIQDELPFLKDQCRELLLAKQDLIDKARTTIVGNRASIQRLQTSMGIPVISDSDDPAYTNFNQVIDEWTVQVRSRTGDEGHEGSEDINNMLFSAIVEGN
ncbi:hypothetical protein L2E82_50706 [Cichorium intybus]|nr:hypothetical protein L2E82_50706 [Cichorium intybus]